MVRKIIKIDEERCNGCGACATACHEGAIDMVDGKAKLVRENYCDGLGDCLPVCPTDAISFEEREAPAYDEAAVLAAKEKSIGGNSRLTQWPVQIKLMPVVSEYYDGADLLVAADCAAYANGNFHNDFMRNKVTVIGCPKLDQTDYSEKLQEIIKSNNIKSVTVARMIVPCCGGIEYAVRKALQEYGKNIPVNVKTITTDGKIIG